VLLPVLGDCFILAEVIFKILLYWKHFIDISVQEQKTDPLVYFPAVGWLLIFSVGWCLDP